MADILYNLRQLTNFDVQNYPSAGQHKVAQVEDSIPVDYVHIDFDKNVVKLGYCCEPRGIGYPIILYFENHSSTFEIGKTGMFEVQIENFKQLKNFQSIDENGAIEQYDNINVQVNIIGIDVPKDFNFVLDYAYPV